MPINIDVNKQTRYKNTTGYWFQVSCHVIIVLLARTNMVLGPIRPIV